MEVVNINNVVNAELFGKFAKLKDTIKKDTKIVGKLIRHVLHIDKQFYKIDLSDLDCDNLVITKQEDLSQYILPKNLKILYLKNIYCKNIQCDLSEFTLPNSLKELYLNKTNIKYLPNLPLELNVLSITESEIKYLPDLPENIELKFNQDHELEFLSYNQIKLEPPSNFKIKMKIKNYGKEIVSQEDLDEYMRLFRVKSDRK